jgi:hypothetical protein
MLVKSLPGVGSRPVVAVRVVYLGGGKKACDLLIAACTRLDVRKALLAPVVG